MFLYSTRCGLTFYVCRLLCQLNYFVLQNQGLVGVSSLCIYFSLWGHADVVSIQSQPSTSVNGSGRIARSLD